jgi:hypothetical protein
VLSCPVGYTETSKESQDGTCIDYRLSDHNPNPNKEKKKKKKGEEDFPSTIERDGARIVEEKKPVLLLLLVAPSHSVPLERGDSGSNVDVEVGGCRRAQEVGA